MKSRNLEIVSGCYMWCTAFVFSYSENADEKAAAPASSSDVTDAETKGTLEEYKAEREEELKQLLQRVDGVGHADVMITLKASNEKVTLKDNTQKESPTRKNSFSGKFKP